MGVALVAVNNAAIRHPDPELENPSCADARVIAAKITTRRVFISSQKRGVFGTIEREPDVVRQSSP
jgi:hypothetical protein